MTQTTRNTKSRTADPQQVAVAARHSLAKWLVSGRSSKGLSVEDVARITKIPGKTIERLESGTHDGLPAEVFVKGFVRNFAKAVGLDEQEALLRYSACGGKVGAMPSAAARALVDSMAALTEVAPSQPAPATAAVLANAPTAMANASSAIEPSVAAPPPVAAHSGSGSQPSILHAAPALLTVVESATPVVESVNEELVAHGDAASLATEVAATAEPRATEVVVDVATAATTYVSTEPSAAEAAPKRGRAKGKRTKKATKQTELAAPAVAIETSAEIALAPAAEPAEVEAMVVDAAVEAIGSGRHRIHPQWQVESQAESQPASDAETQSGWVPKMPAPSMAMSAIPWTRPASTKSVLTNVTPSLVIDDSDPDAAELELSTREGEREGSARKSLIPSILLENDDRGRQGGLTLAVIILLIAATLTLSYLMRRPGSGGEGMTTAPSPAQYTTDRLA